MMHAYVHAVVRRLCTGRRLEWMHYIRMICSHTSFNWIRIIQFPPWLVLCMILALSAKLVKRIQRSFAHLARLKVYAVCCGCVFASLHCTLQHVDWLIDCVFRLLLIDDHRLCWPSLRCCQWSPTPRLTSYVCAKSVLASWATRWSQMPSTLSATWRWCTRWVHGLRVEILFVLRDSDWSIVHFVDLICINSLYTAITSKGRMWGSYHHRLRYQGW